MSEFSGLNMALTALQAQRRGLELAAQNASNTNTDGYSRQRLDLQSVGSSTVPALYATSNGQSGGVQVAGITRFRDQFLEIQAALEHGSLANLNVGSTKMQNIEQLFNEPSDTGLAQSTLGLLGGLRRRRESP